MSKNKDAFPNCQPLQHLLTEFWEPGWVQSQDKVPAEHKGAKTGLLLELWGTTGYEGMNVGEWFAAMNSLGNHKDLSSLKSHQLRLRASV